MKRLSKSKEYRLGLEQAVQQQGLMIQEQAGEQISQWLAGLWLLEGVPFYYLVADPRMLPAESIRFFYISENWLVSLLDGAFSIGRSVTPESRSELEKYRFTCLHDQAKQQALQKRALLLGSQPPDKATDMSGFLLRSAVVSGWPGMEVSGSDSAGNAASLLRFERIAPDVVICIFDRIVETVVFKEPSETLHFGIEQDTGSPQKLLRYVCTGPQGQLPGSQIDKVAAPVTFRGEAARKVIDIAQLKDTIHTLLSENKAIAADGPYTPAEFALEMIQGVQQVNYTIKNPAI